MGRCCIKDHRPEHSLGDERWLNGCAQCEIEKLRAELAAVTADRDSWADQAAQRTQDALDLVAAERERCADMSAAIEAVEIHCGYVMLEGTANEQSVARTVLHLLKA